MARISVPAISGAAPTRIARAVALLPWAVGAELVAAAMLVVVLSGASPARSLGLWAVAWSMAALLSVAVWLRWNRDPQRAARSNSAALHVCAATAARGGVWGLGLAALLHDAASPAIEATALLLAVQTAAVATSAALLPVFGAGLAASVLPWSIAQAFGPLPGGGSLALATVGFAALLLLVAWQADLGHRRAQALEGRLREALEQLETLARSGRSAEERVEAALAAARRAADERMRFLAAASHDLRQPVHAIGLFVSALRDEVPEGRARYLIDRLERSMSGLDELFNRLLEIARLDSGKITPTISTFAIAPMLQTLESRFAAVAERRGLRFRVHAPPHWVRSDPALLIEILMNLLSNAFRYTERGGILLGTRRCGDRLSIQVWDTGVGIERRDTAAIFDEFVQLERSPRRPRQGLGLGLAIVRRIGEVLDCPVSVRSRPGVGSVFQVSVPRVAEPPAASEAGPATDVPLDGLLVLVVDDDMDILVGMEASLASWGCFVLLARTVEETRRHLTLAERFPDLLITDHRLAGSETSEDVVAALRELVPMPVPVLVVSGDADPELELRVRSRGWSWMNKPANPERLRTLVAQAVSEAAGAPAAGGTGG